MLRATRGCDYATLSALSRIHQVVQMTDPVIDQTQMTQEPFRRDRLVILFASLS